MNGVKRANVHCVFPSRYQPDILQWSWIADEISPDFVEITRKKNVKLKGELHVTTATQSPSSDGFVWWQKKKISFQKWKSIDVIDRSQLNIVRMSHRGQSRNRRSWLEGEYRDGMGERFDRQSSRVSWRMYTFHGLFKSLDGARVLRSRRQVLSTLDGAARKAPWTRDARIQSRQSFHVRIQLWWTACHLHGCTLWWSEDCTDWWWVCMNRSRQFQVH